MPGDGLCEEIAPAVFTLLEDGLAYVKEGTDVKSDPGGADGRHWFPRSSRRRSPKPPRSARVSASSLSLRGLRRATAAHPPVGGVHLTLSGRVTMVQLGAFPILRGSQDDGVAAEGLRGDDCARWIDRIGREPVHPCERAPLSRGRRHSETYVDAAAVHSKRLYSDQRVDMSTSTPAYTFGSATETNVPIRGAVFSANDLPVASGVLPRMRSISRDLA